MLGTDIKIEEKDGRGTDKESPLFYVKELKYGMNERKIIRPESVPQIGMETMKSTGWKAFLIDYASSASFHGLNHLAAPHRHPFERIGTVVIIMCCLIALLFLSLTFWNQYQVDATVIVLNHDYHHYTIIKPAMVVCTKDGVDEKKFSKVFKKYDVEDSEATKNFFKIISRSGFVIDTPLPDVNISSDKWLNILYDLKVERSHENGGTWIMTDRGFCQSLYNYAAPYSSFEYWIANNWTVIPEPDSIETCSYLSPACQVALSVVGSNIFQIFPGDIADFSKEIYPSVMQHSSTLTANANQVSASSDIRGLSYKQRDCKFRSDGGLTMWPVYTYNMCKRECIFKSMFRFCGCYHHFARPIDGIPTCDLEQLQCIYNNSRRITSFNKKKAERCGCLPDCDYTYYPAVHFKMFKLSDTAPNVAKFEVNLPFPIEKLIREQVFGFIDFLAAIGGAAGLILGASILSFVEFFYFATLRCFCFYKQQSFQ